MMAFSMRGPKRSFDKDRLRSLFMKLRVLAISLAILALLVALPASGQDPRGTVLGRVTDASSAVVPNAEVRITNENTGVSASAKTNDSGNFVLPYLLPGTYVLSCEMAGFKKWTRPGIQVRVQDSVEVDIQLSVGNASETVEVTDTPRIGTTAICRQRHGLSPSGTGHGERYEHAPAQGGLQQRSIHVLHRWRR
jgi:hypothetical protein